MKNKIYKVYLKNILIYWIPLFLYCLLLFIQSSYPPLKIIPHLKFIPKLVHIDKLLHFLAYIILGILTYRAFYSINNINSVFIKFLMSFVFASLFSLSDEIHQMFVPSRSAEFLDFLADLAGISVGMLSYTNHLNKRAFSS